mmetsp:Transcript_61529/g.102378  ORF Transcript_61529/g.102378 Transcript_61529/m.102378 type:complete len:108 (-) Transcript_61529:408-731(-)
MLELNACLLHLCQYVNDRIEVCVSSREHCVAWLPNSLRLVAELDALKAMGSFGHGRGAQATREPIVVKKLIAHERLAAAARVNARTCWRDRLAELLLLADGVEVGQI